MNGYKILEDAARLLGLSGLDENLKIIGLPLLNEIITELGFIPVSSLSDFIGISSAKYLSALRFGVATLVANALGDYDSRNAMSKIYTAKLSEVKCKVERVRNVIPGGEQ